MIEVFIAFTKGTNIARLERTLEAWNLPGLEPVAIQCGLKKFELHRRVTAENVSRGNYAIVTLDHGPVEENFGEIAEKIFAENPKVGLIDPIGVDPAWTSGDVAVCRKGVIKTWVLPQGSQEMDVLYESAHFRSYENAGYTTISRCPLIHYRVLAESLPLSSGTGKPH